jgi:hypothetical protein
MASAVDNKTVLSLDRFDLVSRSSALTSRPAADQTPRRLQIAVP